MILSRATAHEINSWGRALLYDHRDSLHTFEDASQYICESAFKTFVLDDGSPLFALFRVFRIGFQYELPPELQAQYKNDQDYFVMLAGTSGVEPAWCARQRSVGLQAIPMRSALLRPMFVEAFRQMHIEWGENVSPVLHGADRSLMYYFHVPEARKSPWVVDQDYFVIPYQIQSTIGIGTTFLSKSAYIAIGFARAPVDQENAEKFAQLVPHFSTLLAAYDQAPFWRSQPIRG